MSDSPDEKANPPARPPEKNAAPKARKPRRWRRRIVITLLTIVILAIVLRVATSFALPMVLSRVAAFYNLGCEYDRAELSMIDGNLGIWGLRLKPKSGGEPVATAGYVRARIAPLRLFKGRLHVYRVEADGIQLDVDRAADGSFPLLAVLNPPPVAPRTPASPGPGPAANSSPPPAQQMKLDAPLRVEAFRLQQMQVHFRDNSIAPPIDTIVRVNLRVSDVGAIDRPTTFQLEIGSDELVDAARISGHAHARGTALDAQVAILVRGLKLKYAAAYLQPLGIKPLAHDTAFVMRGDIKANVKENNVIDAKMELADIAAFADGRQELALRKLTINLDSIDFRNTEEVTLLAENAKCSVIRTPEGNLRVAGIELAPVTANPAPAKPVARASAPPPVRVQLVNDPPQTAPALTTADYFRLRAFDIVLKNLQAEFLDQTVSPAVRLAATIDDISLKNRSGDKTIDAPIDISGSIRLPGVARVIKLDGVATPTATRKNASLRIDAQGIALDAVKPYLERAGLESQLRDGQLQCDTQVELLLGDDGLVTTNASIRDMKLSDGGQLFGLKAVTIQGMKSNPKSGVTRYESVVISGPDAIVRREAGGALALLGLRTKTKAAPQAHPTPAPQAQPTPAPPAAAAPVNTPASATAPASPILPKIEIGRLVWTDLKLLLDDAMSSPPVKIALADAGVELTDLRFDLDGKNPSPTPGRIKAWFSAPDVAKNLLLEGTLSPAPSAAEIDLNLSGEGLTAKAIGPYLAALGIEPAVKDGLLTMHAKGRVAQTDKSVTLAMLVDKLRWADGPTELAAVDSLRVDDLVIDGNLALGAAVIDRPRASVTREKDGCLVIAGIRMLVAPAAPPAAQPIAAPPPKPAPAIQPALPVPAPPQVVRWIKKLRVNEAAVAWNDQMPAPPVHTNARVTLELDQLILGKPSEGASISLIAKADNAVEDLRVTGRLLASPDVKSAKLDVSASGVVGGPLASYLPPGMRPVVRNGRFNTSFDATIVKHEKGGQKISAQIAGLEWRDGDAPPMMRLDAVKLIIPRLDVPGKIVAIDEMSISGVEADVIKLKGGALQLLGIEFAAAPAPPPAANPQQPRPAPATQAAQPKIAPVAATQPADTAALVVQARRVWPAVTANKVDLHIKRLSVKDMSRPAAAPMTLADLRLKNLSKIDWLGSDAANKAPTRFELSGKIDPLAQQLQLLAEVAPFALEPTANLDLAVKGINGDGLIRIAPELKEKLDGLQLKDGQITAHLETQLKLDRRAADDFDLSRGFEANLLLKDLNYRAAPGGQVLLGLESLQSEGIRVRPRQSTVQIKSLEITKPIATAMRDEQGLHLLGWIIKLPAIGASTQPTATQPTAAKPASRPEQPLQTAVAAAPPTTAPATRPTGEIRIDKLTLAGVDIRYEDRVMKPGMVIPITGLDVEARDLTTLARHEEKPIRFAVLVNSGKLSLPKKPKGAGIPGAIGDIAAIAGGQKSDHQIEYEERELFSQIAASGKLSLFPQLNGWIKSSVNGLELTGLAGPAKNAGVTIGGGLFDSTVDLRFNGASIDTRSRFVFTDLRMSEPDNGPVVRHLSLGAPLDVVIGILTDADGSITVPLNVTVKDGNIEGLGPAATSAAAAIIGTALASAPIKVVGAVGDIFGLGGDKTRKPEEPRTLAYLPGIAAPEPDQAAFIPPMLEKMKKNPLMEVTIRHELGGGDVARAQARANPSPEDCRNLAGFLRDRKIQLMRLRSTEAGRAKALLVSSDPDAQTAVAQLRAIDREIAQNEDALDRVYDLLRPGAERQAARRTRAAAIEIGRQRIDQIRQTFLNSGLPDIEQRVRIANPQFNPDETDAGGRLIVQLVAKQKKK